MKDTKEMKKEGTDEPMWHFKELVMNETSSAADLSIPFVDSHVHLDGILECSTGEVSPTRDTLTTFLSSHPGIFGSATHLVHIGMCPRGLDSATSFLSIPDSTDGTIPIIRGTLGVHPDDTLRWSTDLGRTIHEVVTQNNHAVGWGECGLDKENGIPLSDQLAVFKEQLSLASCSPSSRHLPIVLHARGYEDEAIDVIRETLPRGTPVHLHCFTGTKKQFLRALEDPAWVVGAAGAVSFVQREQLRKDLFEDSSLLFGKRLVLETDAPFLAPPPYRRHISHPGFIPLIASAISNTIPQLSTETILKETAAAAISFYSLPL